MIVSVLLSFVRNAIGQDELPLRKRLIKQVACPFRLQRAYHLDMAWRWSWVRALLVSGRCVHCRLVHACPRYLGLRRGYLGVGILHDCIHPNHRKSLCHRSNNVLINLLGDGSCNAPYLHTPKEVEAQNLPDHGGTRSQGHGGQITKICHVCSPFHHSSP